MGAITPKISEEMNSKLIEPYNEVEIRSALFQMHPEKAPGIDGFSAIFYQRYWEILKDDVYDEVLKFINDDLLDCGLNITQLILLLKKEDSCKVEDFRPISLCNVTVKIITKVLANRLNGCLQEVISHNQCAFIKNKSIMDNVLLDHEADYSIRRRTKGNEGYISIKMDMSKACDRVEWGFLREMLCRLGFHSSWVNKVMEYVETVRYSVKLNGKISKEIIPSRRLRQGDPLSPYLLLICQEWFSSQLLVMHCEKRIEGIRVAPGLARLNHLFFANDCLLFIKTELTRLQSLKQLLIWIERVAGQ